MKGSPVVWLTRFLSDLETAVPPPGHRHHAVTCCKYSTSDGEVSDRLALHVWKADGSVQDVWIEDADFDKPVGVAVKDCCQLLAAADLRTMRTHGSH